ncbi:MAG: hypothetical protein HFJ28_07085 [Clostridia bacterium]|jgi:protein arginine kinase activator|nr:hypothetical protein [Clostridia bacterium]
MLCQHCGKNEVNFRYTQIINGVKKEMALCDKCAKSLGLESLDFNMPINFSSFLGDFFGGETADFLPSFTKTQTLKCNHCKTTYDEFVETGKFGCSKCYDVFSEGLNNVLKNIQGSIAHIGRKSRLSYVEKKQVSQDIQKAKKEVTKLEEKVETKKKGCENNKEERVQKLNSELKQAIKEERYEDAAKIRDEIKRLC